MPLLLSHPMPILLSYPTALLLSLPTPLLLSHPMPLLLSHSFSIDIYIQSNRHVCGIGLDMQDDRDRDRHIGFIRVKQNNSCLSLKLTTKVNMTGMYEVNGVVE